MAFNIIAALSKIVARFGKAEHGNVAMMFAFLMVPLIGAVGAVIDYNRAVMARTEMQDALDAAALFLSRNPATPKMSDAALQTAASNAFYANFNNPFAEEVTLDPEFDASGPTVKVSSAAIVPTNFMQILGFKRVPIAAKSTVTWGQERLRVSLVLDNTGSMSDAGKMAALKLATHKLLGHLKNAAANPGDVFVSVVPFAKDVNLGAANYAQNWIDWTDWNRANGTCSNPRYSDQTACEQRRGRWTVADHRTWNGCVTDRTQNYDTTNAAPVAGQPATMFPAEQYSECPVAVQPLTENWTTLGGLVDRMRPAGNTNQAIGLQLGWQSLTNAPFAIPPQEPGFRYKEIIILLTDGMNTQNRWTSSQSAIDARERIACGAIKAAKIDVFTVQVNTGSDPLSTMLRDCASDPSQFFHLRSADAIVSTFNSIGMALSDLRIAS